MIEPLQGLEQFIDGNGRHWVPLAEATAEVERLTRVLDLYRSAVSRGGVFVGPSRSALKRAWDEDQYEQHRHLEEKE